MICKRRTGSKQRCSRITFNLPALNFRLPEFFIQIINNRRSVLFLLLSVFDREREIPEWIVQDWPAVRYFPEEQGSEMLRQKPMCLWQYSLGENGILREG